MCVFIVHVHIVICYHASHCERELLQTFIEYHFPLITPNLREANKNQEEGKTTVVEIMVTKELGDPFRRDAMKLPVRHLEKYKATSQVEESSTGQPTDL